MKCQVISQAPVYDPVTPNQKDTDKSTQGSFVGRETTALNKTQPECKLLGGGENQEQMSYEAICEAALDLLNLTQIRELVKRGKIRDFLHTHLLKISQEYELVFKRTLITALKEELNCTNPSPVAIRCCLAAMFTSAKGSDAQRLNGVYSLAFDLMRHVSKKAFLDNFEDIGSGLTHYQECQEALLLCERHLSESIRDSGIQLPNSTQAVNPCINRAIRAFSNAHAFFNSRGTDTDELASQCPKPPKMSQSDPSIDQDIQDIISEVSTDIFAAITADTETMMHKIIQQIENRQMLLERYREVVQQLQEERYKNRYKTCREQFLQGPRYHPH